jgi:hypothetical protein
VDLGSKVAALVWHDLEPDSARFVVSLRDGSILRAPRLTSEEDAIVVHDIAASALRLPLAALAEIQRE